MHRLFTSSFAKPFQVLLLLTLSLTDQVAQGVSPSTPPIITVTQGNPIRQDHWLLVAGDRAADLINLLPAGSASAKPAHTQAASVTITVTDDAKELSTPVSINVAY
ncbi:MAG: hypothetical protein PHF31_01445 [Methylobacter sp.]|nr:hypothetical protein [Methylobacter sp.]